MSNVDIMAIQISKAKVTMWRCKPLLVFFTIVLALSYEKQGFSSLTTESC